MARGASTFRQQDVTRALKATAAAGIEVQRIEIGNDGKIVLVTGKPKNTDDAPVNELDRELAVWEERHAG